MKSTLFCLVAIAAGASSHAQSNAPDVPSLTVGAEIKGLRFDWEQVEGATRYVLEYKPYENSAFGDLWSVNAPATTIKFRLPLHLYFWTYARYRLAACNDAGCTRSPEVSVSSLRRFAVGYFKPDQTFIAQRFGEDTDLSADGRNFVSSAPGDFITSGGDRRPGGAIYLYRFNAGVWRQRARLEPTIPPYIEGSNAMKVAISADGNTVALGMPNYFHEEFDEQSGEVFVFRFNGSSWTRTRLRAGSRGDFGRWVGLSDDGNTLAVARGGHWTPSPSLPPKITIYKLIDGSWQPVRDIGNRYSRPEFCEQGVLSGDGSTVAESCREDPVAGSSARVYIRTHAGPNWTVREDLPLQMSASSDYGYGHGAVAIDGTGNTVAANIFVANGPNPQNGPAEVHVFARTNGVYQKVRTLRPGPWRLEGQRDFFGRSIAISGNGAVLAVGDTWDNGLGYGPRAAPLNPGDSRTGAVYVYRYYDDWWYLYNMVKPNYHPDDAPYDTFGSDVEFSANGVAMIVGESGESSDAEGIGGRWSNIDAAGAGAVWLY